MGYWSVSLELSGRPCLVVGGGEVAQRKIQGLLDVGALVRLVGRRLTPTLSEWVAKGRVEYLGPEYSPEQMDGVFLVFSATNDPEISQRLGREALKRGILFNAADRPDLCTFLVPASFSRGDLTISVSTGGASPAVAAQIRKRLESEFGQEYAMFLEVMRAVRKKLLAQNRPSKENKEIFRTLAGSSLPALILEDDWAGLNELLGQVLGPGYGLEELGLKLPAASGEESWS